MNPFANIKSSVKNSVLVVGMVMCIAPNTSSIIDMNCPLECPKIIYGKGEMNESNSQLLIQCQIRKEEFRFEQEARQLFGEMREATVQEREAIQNYMKKISKPTGRNFWDQC